MLTMTVGVVLVALAGGAVPTTSVSEVLMPAQAKTAVTTVASVDLDRYLGEWFEIARFANRFQQKCAGDVKAAYARRADGGIDVINSCRTADGGTSVAKGVARVVDQATRTAGARLGYLVGARPPLPAAHGHPSHHIGA